MFAFPRPAVQDWHGPQSGLTAHQWFGGKALEGLVAGMLAEDLEKITPQKCRLVARAAKRMADAMVQEFGIDTPEAMSSSPSSS